MNIALAGPQDLDAVLEIVALCIRQMREAGSDQWDEIYPTRAVFEADAQSGALYVLRAPNPAGGQQTKVIGAVVINDVQADEYSSVAWRFPDPRPFVIHRLCVHPDRQGLGAGRRLMDFAESSAVARGYASIRLDTYTGNPRAVALYEQRGYRPAGFVRFPRRRLPFLCMELVCAERLLHLP